MMGFYAVLEQVPVVTSKGMWTRLTSQIILACDVTDVTSDEKEAELMAQATLADLTHAGYTQLYGGGP